MKRIGLVLGLALVVSMLLMTAVYAEHQHTVIYVDEIPATSSTTGISAWSYCSECGEILVKPEVIPILAPSQGWNCIDGKWYYYENTRYITGWKQLDGVWYYFRSEAAGEMAVGWARVGADWYYFSPSGAMATGWAEDAGSWYYFNKDGTMYTGWLRDGKDWYLLKPGGELATGWYSAGGVWYYFKPSGAMADGWQQIDGSWYYFRDGAMVTGWFEDREAEKKLPKNRKQELWYWFDQDGTMATGWKEINGQWEMFDNGGLWLYTWDGK